MTKSTKVLSLSFALALTTSFLNPSVIQAAEVNMKVGHQTLAFEVEPFVEDGRTLTPLRELLIGLGIPNDDAHIIWNKEKQAVTIIKDDIHIELTVGNKEIYKNGKKFAELEVPAKLVIDHVFIPARSVAEALGHKVIYEASTRTVLIDPETIVYSDITKLKPIVEQAIQIINGKSMNELNDQAKDSLAYLMLIDQKQLAEALYESYDKNRKAMLYFMETYYLDKLGMFIEIAVDSNSPASYRIALSDMMATLSGDSLVKQLEAIMKSHPSKDVRYSTSFYLYKYPTSQTMKIFEDILPNEQADDVFINAAASYQSIGRTMPTSYTTSLFTSYMNASEKQREKYKSYLILNVRNHDTTKEAWNTLLKEKIKSGSEQEKETATELQNLK